MRTIGRRHVKGKGKGAFLCDVCGVPWYASQLRKRRDGLWHCPDDIRGRDRVTLSEANANSQISHAGRHKPEGARWDMELGEDDVDQLTDGDHLP